MEVQSAQVPIMGPDCGTPYAWTTRELIGGEAAYGEGGPVARGTEVVGKMLHDGVLAVPEPGAVYGGSGGPGVMAFRSAGPSSSHSSDCRGDLSGNHQPQALWVFSTDACGIFGLSNLRLAHAGSTERVGQITLVARQGKVKLETGSGMLLRVNDSMSQ